MSSRSIVYAGIYARIYLHTIITDGIVSRDGLRRGVLPSGILKMEKYCPGLKVRFPKYCGAVHSIDLRKTVNPKDY